MLVRHEAFVAVGGFDETYFLCFEEMDLAHRLADAGWTVELCGRAHAEHAGGASRGQMPARGAEHFVRSQVHYLQSWQGPFTARVFVIVAHVSWWLRRRLGRMTAESYASMVHGLRTPLRPKGPDNSA
jgi:GT2 family glycosyltransferase